MTSKEALEQLRKYNSVGLCGDKTLFEPIEKDLEILEILRKHLSFRIEWNNVFFETDDYDVLLPLDDIEKEAIEEWLDEKNV